MNPPLDFECNFQIIFIFDNQVAQFSLSVKFVMMGYMRNPQRLCVCLKADAVLLEDVLVS